MALKIELQRNPKVYLSVELLPGRKKASIVIGTQGREWQVAIVDGGCRRDILETFLSVLLDDTPKEDLDNLLVAMRRECDREDIA